MRPNVRNNKSARNRLGFSKAQNLRNEYNRRENARVRKQVTVISWKLSKNIDPKTTRSWVWRKERKWGAIQRALYI